MKLAFIADIHGNSHGLDAVLADIEANHELDGYWFVGDYCAAGPDPIGVLERISKLDNAVFIGGNGETRLFSEHYPGPSVEEMQQRPELISLALTIRAVKSWTIGSIVTTGWVDWIKTLPLEQRLRLPDGTGLLMVHASPGRDSGDGLYPAQSDEKLEQLAAGCEDDLIVVGHTHVPHERQPGKHHRVNPGSVGQPMSGDPRACYAILEADETGYQFSFHRVDYDREAFLDFARQQYYPYIQDLIDYFEGKNTADKSWY